MSRLAELKKEYNYWLNRNENAEVYFNKNEVDECLKHLKLFNDILVKLSNLQKEYKDITGYKMTKDEKLKGFK